jgi:hypothetical protein
MRDPLGAIGQTRFGHAVELIVCWLQVSFVATGRLKRSRFLLGYCQYLTVSTTISAFLDFSPAQRGVMPTFLPVSRSVYAQSLLCASSLIYVGIC